MRKKILLVDDSNTILMMEKMVLRNAYEVVTASNGEEAVERALKESPDLILMDVVMPKMNGFEACRRLRELEATRNVPVIMVTTRGEALNVEAGFESGCNDYITKPIDTVELWTKLKDQLGS
jgi:CheY-like chemotaxis protein